ncbi:MAG TPA: CAP domain-containing protein [Thermomicrobiales bacterium]|nr:CAP domain-containing protein [Thermomicrobiales bacterium]
MRYVLAAICAAVLILSTLTVSAPRAAAVQEHDPEIATALNTINLYRSWLGIPPLTTDPGLQKASENHVEYYRLNFGDPSLAGMGLHEETAGRPGFTGASFQDRARSAGYTGSVNENAGVSGSMIWSVDWFIATVGHRLTLLDPRYVDVGMAAINSGNIKFEIIMLGAPAWRTELEPTWIAWPPHESTGVSLSFSGEAPNPFPGASYPVGYPIHLKYFGPGSLELTSATISKNGVNVPSFSEIGAGWLSRQTVLLCSSAPLEAGMTYSVRIEGRANGQSFVKTWSFTTRVNSNERLALGGQTELPPPSYPLPAGLAHAHPSVKQLWNDTDGAVAALAVERSWLWGPDTWLGLQETSLESPGGVRDVYYFDKARMEVNASDGNDDTLITAGLLVRDMIVGRIQIGEHEYQEYHPANVPLAGDEREFNPDSPTYASLQHIASVEQGRAVAQRSGQPISETLSKDGAIASNESLASWARYASYEPTLGHNIADVFDAYLATLPGDWRMSVGLPLSEPYWVHTYVAGDATWVLVQAFERRILTFTPTNRPEWRVEMGNVGRHYYAWRYRDEPPDIP